MARSIGFMPRLVMLSVLVVIVCVAGTVEAGFTLGEPVNLALNTEAAELSPSLTGDGLELYFMRTPILGTPGANIWLVRRSSTNEPWGQPQPASLPTYVLGEVDDYWSPVIADDGLTLYLTSDSGTDDRYGGSDIYVAIRETRSDPWSEPENLGPVVNTSQWEVCSDISPDGLTLYFSGAPWDPVSDMWITTRPTKEDAWTAPQNLGARVNSSSIDSQPWVSTDGLTLVFGSARPGGQGEDLWMARSRESHADWETPMNLGPIVNSPHIEGEPEISPDGSMLYFISDRPDGQGQFDIWEAAIIPVVDFNDDEAVDVLDTLVMVENWGVVGGRSGPETDLCDIAPLPLGDGIVDAKDLLSLAEHMIEYVEDVNDTDDAE